MRLDVRSSALRPGEPSKRLALRAILLRAENASSGLSVPPGMLVASPKKRHLAAESNKARGVSDA
jgi:hypothetical protein